MKSTKDSDSGGYRALATDFDETLATAGVVPEPTRRALQRWRGSGRAAVLVTGRVLNDLKRVCPDLDVLFDRVVTENGTELHRPATGETRLLCSPVADDLVLALRHRGVVPFGLGRVVVGTRREQAEELGRIAEELGIPVSVSYNKSSVMVLPAGVDKGSGLRAALDELAIGVAATIGFGDAENDLPFVKLCGRRIAVANAVPELRALADEVTHAPSGEGVAEIIERLLPSAHPES
jgi:hydroxymethylpyrimidine pyrophosphatase-like HAD family hydrolase